MSVCYFFSLTCSSPFPHFVICCLNIRTSETSKSKMCAQGTRGALPFSLSHPFIFPLRRSSFFFPPQSHQTAAINRDLLGELGGEGADGVKRREEEEKRSDGLVQLVDI